MPECISGYRATGYLPQPYPIIRGVVNNVSDKLRTITGKPDRYPGITSGDRRSGDNRILREEIDIDAGL